MAVMAINKYASLSGDGGHFLFARKILYLFLFILLPSSLLPELTMGTAITE